MKCRSCLNSAAEYIELGTHIFPGKTYMDCFNVCTQLNADLNDDLPNLLCCSCAQNLQIAYDFVETARNSDVLLRSMEEENNVSNVVQFLNPTNEAFVNADIVNMEIVVIEPIEEPLDDEPYECYSENNEDYIVEASEQHNIATSLIEDNISFEEQITSSKNLRPFKCLKCSKTFRCPKTLERHTLKHKDILKYKKIPNETQESQVTPGFIALLSCEHCDRIFESGVLLEIHEMIQHNFTLKTTCLLCNKRLYPRNSNQLMEHLLLEHPIEHAKVEGIEYNIANTDENLNQSEITNNKNNLEKSDQECEEISTVDCSFCKKKILQHNIEKHLSLHMKRETKFLCTHCPRHFKNQKSLRQHEKSHYEESEDTVYVCADCNRQYSSRALLEQHHKNAHKEKDNVCSICGNAFKLKSQLINHMKLHLEKNIQCPHCDKKYARHFDLTVHLRSHTGELPYACHLCDKRFAIKVRLTYHLQKHYGVKHTCKECEAEFNSKQKLKAHSFKHIGMPYRCKLCEDHGFPNRDVFKRHLLRVHHATISEEALLEMFQRYTGKTTRICDITTFPENDEKTLPDDLLNT